MKNIIVARSIKHLRELIEQEMNLNSSQCDLNHIDVSKIKSMKNLFKGTKFNGDISKWDVSNVKDMDYMFENSSFNGDLSNWKPYKLHYPKLAFYYSKTPHPYWSNYNDPDARKKAIDTYWLAKNLQENLSNSQILTKKPKI